MLKKIIMYTRRDTYHFKIQTLVQENLYQRSIRLVILAEPIK